MAAATTRSTAISVTFALSPPPRNKKFHSPLPLYSLPDRVSAPTVTMKV